MNSILPLENENVSGVNYIEFIPAAHIATLPDSWESEVNTFISVVFGKQFFELYATEQTLQFKCSEDKSSPGSVHKLTVSGFTPKAGLDREKIFAEMRESKLIVVCYDNNGNKRLCGTLTNPLHFTYSEDTLAEYGGRQGYAWSFFADLEEPPPYYTV